MEREEEPTEMDTCNRVVYEIDGEREREKEREICRCRERSM